MIFFLIAAILASDETDRTKRIAELTAEIAKSPKEVDLYSERGDLHFFSGRFKESFDDYEKMVEIEPRIDVKHWRKGIALFYLERWEESAKQFEKYQTVDDVDRENGIWRFMAMQRKIGTKKAREDMIPYTRMDRPPLTPIYRMFQGELASAEFKKQAAEFKDGSKERFYADLYLGIFLDIEGDMPAALKHLKAAEDNKWAKESGGGPGWMRHIAPIHAKFIEKQRQSKDKKSS